MNKLEKTYGLYNIEDFEQCEFIGTKKEIASFLGLKVSAIFSYLNRKRKGKQNLLLEKYDIVELEEINE